MNPHTVSLVKMRLSKQLICIIILSLISFFSLSNAQNDYLDEAGWDWLNNSSSFFDQAFATASAGNVPAQIAQQYTITLTQLFQTSLALESDLRRLQGSYQEDTNTIPYDLIYLTTAVGALSSGMSALTDYYQQLQSARAEPINLQTSLRLAHLNSTIYWLSYTLYLEKANE